MLFIQKTFSALLVASLLMLGACEKISTWFGKEEPAATVTCQYRAQPETFEIHWTAFKTTEKLPVKGTFKDIRFQGAVQSGKLADLFKTYSVVIDGKTVETHNPGRNATVSEFFFGLWLDEAKIEARVLEARGNLKKGQLKIELALNQVKQVLNFDYQADAEGLLRANALLKMPDFQLGKAFNSLHQACESLHTGKDGVSKTWQEVELEILGRVEKSCSSDA